MTDPNAGFEHPGLDDDQTDVVTCAVHGERLREAEAREQGWRLEQDGYAKTVCQRFTDPLAVEKMNREEFG